MLKYFICTDKEKINIDSCLHKCRLGSRCCPLPYLYNASRNKIWSGKPSVTQLIKGTREAYLEIISDYAVNPKDRAFMLLGSKAHLDLENISKKYNVLQEIDLEYNSITGIADLYYEENGFGTLVDYKTAGSYKVKLALGIYHEYETELDSEGNPILYKSGYKKGQPKTKKILKQSDEKIDIRDWELQTSMYAIMLRNAGFPVKKIKIFCIVRDGGTKMALQNGITENVYYIDVNPMITNRVLDYFNFKKELLLQALRDKQIPPMCKDDENWHGRKCVAYCPVKEFCPDNPYLNNINNEDMLVLTGGNNND